MKLILFHLLILSISVLSAQNIALKLADSIIIPKNKFEHVVGIDTQENYYFSKYEVVTKTDGNEEWVYANYELGEPTSVSILNVLQILIFYQGSNIIILLDRFMNETQRIDLNSLNPPKIIGWVENTKNQEAWLLNSISNRLEVYNYRTNLLLSQTIPFLQQPKDLAADFSFSFVLFDSEICKFNTYGTQVSCTPVSNIEELFVGDKYVVGVSSESKIVLFDKSLKQIGLANIPKNNVTDFSVKNEKLYIYNGSRVYTYLLNLPTK